MLPWGGRGRGFKSRHSDQRQIVSQTKNASTFVDAFFVIQIVFDSIMRKDILKIVIARRGFVMSFFNDAQKEALHRDI